MKSAFKIMFLAVLALSMTACTANNASQAAAKSTTGTAASTGTASTTALPELSKLIIGTFKLEGTENAVTASQAQDLLFLWEGYKELTTRDSAADEEKAALISQIGKSMTTEQMSAIEAMNLTQKDVMETVTQYGGSQAIKTTTSSSSSSTRTGSGNFQGGGGPGGGGMPGGGGGGMPMDGGGGDVPPDMAAGNQSSSSTGSTTENSGVQVSVSQLLDPLIKLLEARVNG
mgnify:CR=1 FL=1